MEIELKNLSKKFNEKSIFNNFNFKFHSSKRVCSVWSNGSGKTTLLKLISNLVKEDDGEISSPIKIHQFPILILILDLSFKDFQRLITFISLAALTA